MANERHLQNTSLYPTDNLVSSSIVVFIWDVDRRTGLTKTPPRTGGRIIEDRNTIIIGKITTSGYWVTSNERGNELGNESACGKRLIFATGLRQTYGSTCDTPFGKVSGKMGLSKFPPRRGPHAL